MMFRVIGGAVVYGFALYGAAKFIDRPQVKVLIKANTSKQKGKKPGDLPLDATPRPGSAGSVAPADEVAEAMSARAAD